ncbi:metallophosphoesterase [Candidatus Nomurabacteria bacterium]|nr:metallophosphoesterase [Candidatus Nomurabacteria bacterium]
MKIAIISDIHENFHNLVLFLKQAKKYDAEKIIFLGDFINNGIAKTLASSDIPVIAIWGNNDGDKVAITKTSLSEQSNMTIGFDTYDFLEIDDRKIFITHYPLLAKPMAKSGEFDAVFYGHDHKKNLDKINDCIIVNPGEISAHKTGTASFAIYDTKANNAEIIDIEGIVSTKTKEATEHLKSMKFTFSKSKTHEY